MPIPRHAILGREHVASIREIQRNPSRALHGITRVVRGSKTIGIFLDNDELDDLLEDFEALSSPRYLTRVRKARRELRSGKGTSLDVIARRYGV
ncbi:MAG: hypothetical protein Q7R80_01020 [bacterium]|nr:hypothetical protein [bacterium]MDP3771318.1 hypothetical protein [bacterium]